MPNADQAEAKAKAKKKQREQAVLSNWMRFKLNLLVLASAFALAY